MEHIFYPAENAKGTLILLHGTGGDEHSLLPVARELSNDMNFLGVRGNVNENGANRFFKRIAEGVFDMEDLRYRTTELAEFIKTASEKYNFSLETTFLLGYSNGANIAANAMLGVQNIAIGAILLHAMVPSRDSADLSLAGKHIFMSAGTFDPLVPKFETEELYQIFKEKGASATINWEQNDHRITHSELAAAKKWLANIQVIS